MRRTGLPSARGIAALLLCMTLVVPSYADDTNDHDKARQVLEAGEILPLKTVLEKLEREVPGRVLEVDLERKKERWVYEIKLLRSGGALVKLKIDATDGTIFSRKEK